MNSQNQSQTMPIAIAFLLGLVIGLLVLGWVLFPKEFTSAGPQYFSNRHLDNYVTGLAIKHSGDNDGLHIMRAVCYPTDDYTAIANRAAEITAEPALRGNYDRIINIVAENGGCEAFKVIPENEPTTTNNTSSVLWTLCIAGLLIFGLIGLLFYLLRGRGGGGGGEARSDTQRTRREVERTEFADDEINFGNPEANEVAPIPQEDAQTARQQQRKKVPAPRPSGPPTQLAGFQTTYVRGDDTFDKSFIIENANGDFLGECGVSISESIGATGDSKNVTAFEIWLFDKNDTHTVTKVVMSHHAYDDEGFRAKLATRGEPVLAHYDETIVLETVSLIINADITEIDYTDIDPLDSTFDRFTIKLSAWVKANTSSGDALDF